MSIDGEEKTHRVRAIGRGSQNLITDSQRFFLIDLDDLRYRHASQRSDTRGVERKNRVRRSADRRQCRAHLGGGITRMRIVEQDGKIANDPCALSEMLRNRFALSGIGWIHNGAHREIIHWDRRSFFHLPRANVLARRGPPALGPQGAMFVFKEAIDA